MVAISQTSICNLALQLIGADNIVSINDDQENARQCLTAYDSIRVAELRKHSWRFAIKRQLLAPLTEPPPFGFTYQFPLPEDYLRLIKPNDRSLDWQLESNRILTNQGTSLELKYIADIVDVSKFDSNFVIVFAHALAIQLEFITIQSGPMGDRLKLTYDVIIKEAKKMNAFEVVPVSSEQDSWELARF